VSESDCIFCKIVRGEIPSAEIYSTDKVFAFLDIAPVRNGHALVIPKTHYPTLWDLPPDLAADMLAAIQVVGKAIMEGTNAEGLNLGMNNYEAAGQLVPHAHFHLIPRNRGDGLKLWDQHPYDTQDELRATAAAILKKIGK